MSRILWEDFFSEEGIPYVRSLLRAALDDWKAGQAKSIYHFEFNRFDITINVDDGVAVLQDVLDVTEAGSQQISLDELDEMLGSSASGDSPT